MTTNYCQKHKEKLPKEARQNPSEEEKDKMSRKTWENYQNLTEEEKEKKLQYHRNNKKVIRIFLRKKKKKLSQYKRNYYISHKNCLAAL